MTPNEAAHQAADRDGITFPYGGRLHALEIYVRAFLAGTQWQQRQETNEKDFGKVRVSPP